jgi:CheY-like chemotaxis protein/PAS domain-containing protein
MDRQTHDQIYLKKSRLLPIIGIITYGFIRSVEIIVRGLNYRNALEVSLFCGCIAAALFVLMYLVKDKAKLAFYVPFITFVGFAAGSVYLKDFEYFFIIWLGICGIGCIYHNFKKLLSFFITSNVIIFFLFLFNFITPNTLPQALAQWSFAVCTSTFFLISAQFSSKTDSRTAKMFEAFSLLMETTPHLMAVVDESNGITCMSRRLKEFIRVEDSDVITGKPLLDLIDDPEFKMMIKEILETRDFFEGTKKITDAGGTPRTFKFFSKQLEGDVPGRFIDIADITQDIQFQNKMEKTPPVQKAFLTAINYEIKPSFNGIQNRNPVRSYMPYGKVLVADEGMSSPDAVKNLLLPYGLLIDGISSGREAVERIRNETIKYDVVFMDPLLPRIDGIEVIRIIRDKIGTEYAKNLPIIALTVSPAGDGERFLSGGFTALIQKPIDSMCLDTILNQWVRDKQPEESLLKAERTQVNHVFIGEPPLEILESLDAAGVDFERGVQCYDREAAYVQILQSYRLHIPELLKKLEEISPNNLSEYATVVHIIKGSSYIICADDIGEQAEALEQAAQTGDYKKVQMENNAFIKQVERVLNGIRDVLETPAIKESHNSLPGSGLIEKNAACRHAV